MLDIPLLVESAGNGTWPGIVVVDVDPEVAVRRLVEHRGMREDDARARMARQATREERLAKADLVIDNSGTLEELEARIDGPLARDRGPRDEVDVRSLTARCQGRSVGSVRCRPSGWCPTSSPPATSRRPSRP